MQGWLVQYLSAEKFSLQPLPSHSDHTFEGPPSQELLKRKGTLESEYMSTSKGAPPAGHRLQDQGLHGALPPLSGAQGHSVSPALPLPRAGWKLAFWLTAVWAPNCLTGF